MPPLAFAIIDLRLVAVLALWVLALAGAWIVYARWRAAELARRRAWAEDQALSDARAEIEDLEGQNFLRRWLYLAGFRSHAAPSMFLAATVVGLVAGLAVALTLTRSGIIDESVRAAGEIPGGVGDLAMPLMHGAPWIFMAVLALAPIAIVSSARTRRTQEIEQDMPVTLEMLATMSESGLSFDGAMTKVIETSPPKRPLFQEMRTFQIESLSGVGRVDCFRRLARRIELPSVNVFASALVQAEQVGAGFTRVLRTQADDMRNRRREDANMLAQSLTVKLVFPLVICFLPGIFVTTLGPTFLQFLKLAEGMTRGG
ncbi:MAG: type II secretion system F family protein [Planctomycetes bacterium]|nr:type II secretion system F family protein [Planctomycetota bacterium]